MLSTFRWNKNNKKVSGSKKFKEHKAIKKKGKLLLILMFLISSVGFHVLRLSIALTVVPLVK